MKAPAFLALLAVAFALMDLRSPAARLDPLMTRFEIDLYSDTKTRPSRPMREAAAAADVCGAQVRPLGYLARPSGVRHTSMALEAATGWLNAAGGMMAAACLYAS
jgi:hypothetical protein